jgi:hypothetical protein
MRGEKARGQFSVCSFQFPVGSFAFAENGKLKTAYRFA